MTTEAPAAGEPRPRPNRVLVVEHDPIDDVRLLVGWLGDGGAEPVVTRPHAGDPLPGALDAYAALVVLGREPLTAGDAGRSLESLLRRAVESRTPTLGIGVGARLLATAHGAELAPAESGPQLGHRLIARRDAADRDPVFGPMPLAPDVIQWHVDEITRPPDGAVVLAVSTGQAIRAFRIGPVAWGLRLHLECELETVAAWAMDEAATIVAAGYDAVELLDTVDRALPDVEQAWGPLVAGFARLAVSGSRDAFGGPS